MPRAAPRPTPQRVKKQWNAFGDTEDQGEADEEEEVCLVDEVPRASFAVAPAPAPSAPSAPPRSVAAAAETSSQPPTLRDLDEPVLIAAQFWLKNPDKLNPYRERGPTAGSWWLRWVFTRFSQRDQEQMAVAFEQITQLEARKKTLRAAQADDEFRLAQGQGILDGVAARAPEIAAQVLKLAQRRAALTPDGVPTDEIIQKSFELCEPFRQAARDIRETKQKMREIRMQIDKSRILEQRTLKVQAAHIERYNALTSEREALGSLDSGLHSLERSSAVLERVYQQRTDVQERYDLFQHEESLRKEMAEAEMPAMQLGLDAQEADATLEEHAFTQSIKQAVMEALSQDAVRQTASVSSGPETRRVVSSAAASSLGTAAAPATRVPAGPAGPAFAEAQRSVERNRAEVEEALQRGKAQAQVRERLANV